MGGEPPVICSSCGHVLGPSEEEIAHPDDPDPPDDPHFKVQIRDDGEERFQCLDSGRLASPVGPGDDGIGGDNLTYAEVFEKHHGEKPPGMGEPSGGVGQQSPEPNRQDQNREGIYDIDEEKTQMDLLEEVITNPRYGLNDEHIQEVRGWAEDMDGRLPPQDLESILKNLKGIAKQTAQLVRQRYSLKLNKWMREQSHTDEGPPIGVTSQPMPGQRGSQPRGGRPTPTPSGKQKSKNKKQDKDKSKSEGRPSRGRKTPSSGSLRKKRRRRRVERRQEVMDITAQKVADQAADEIAREIVGNFGTYFGLPAKIIEAKVEKDPDWALEKAEQFDIDIMELLEPSEQRKKEMEQEGREHQPEVDNEIDDALENIRDNNGQQPEETSETTNTPPLEEQEEDPMSATPEDNTPLDLETDEQYSEDNISVESEDERAGAELFE